MATTRAKKIFQPKVILNDTAPAVWRRLLVPADMTLGRFHHVLQEAMGWWPKDEEYDSMLTWLDGYFDPASFDANGVNRTFRFERM